MAIVISQNIKLALIAGSGAMLCISALASMEQLMPQTLWLMAPFGATMVILFALPDSPLAQPKNIVFGHILTSIIGLSVLHLMGVSPFSLGLAVGLGVALMMLTHTLHPPAGANPLAIMLTAQSWDFLYSPLASGLVLILSFGYLYHNVICRRPYAK